MWSGRQTLKIQTDYFHQYSYKNLELGIDSKMKMMLKVSEVPISLIRPFHWELKVIKTGQF